MQSEGKLSDSSCMCTPLCRCPDMAELLTYCGPKVFDGPLPWDGTI